MLLLAQAKLEDVFRSTAENLDQAPSSERLLAFVLVLAAVTLLLLLLNHRRKKPALPKPLNHHGKLMKEVLRQVPLRSGDLKRLKTLADRQRLESPLVLLLCPSLLKKK